MTDEERTKLAEALHKELSENTIPHIICVVKSNRQSADCACAGSWDNVIKMIGTIIDTYSKQLGVSKKDICHAIVIALGGKRKKTND